MRLATCWLGCSLLVLVSGPVVAQDAWRLQDWLSPETPARIQYGGWLDTGYHSGTTIENGNIPLAFDTVTKPDAVRLHQAWGYLERKADGRNGLDWGFRADVLYGTDAHVLQAYGNPPAPPYGGRGFDNGADLGIYGWAVPQLFAELAYGDFRVIAGHFMKLQGFETWFAPQNFFYSHTFATSLGEPHTHTGALVSYQVSPDVQVFAGQTFGMDTAFTNSDGGCSLLTGMLVRLSDSCTLAYAGNYGNLGWFGQGSNQTAYLTTDLTDRVRWVLQGDIVNTHAPLSSQFPIYAAGFTNYLFYRLTDQWSCGGRVEWWKSRGVFSGTAMSQSDATVGLNYQPVANLRVRAEYRHNWGALTDFGSGDPNIFGIDAILTF